MDIRATVVTAILLLISLEPATAAMGYDITATVGSTSWSINRSTTDIDFRLTNSVCGNGTFSKLFDMEGFAGFEAAERASCTNKSSLDYQEQLYLQGREGPLLVTTRLKSGKTETKDDDEDVSVSIDESAEIEIDERWPAYFADYKTITYYGQGLRLRESYTNNGDVVESSVDAWSLSRESFYRSTVNRTIISVNVTPQSVEQTVDTNKSSHYALDMSFVGPASNFHVLRRGRDKKPQIDIHEDYAGEEKIFIELDMDDWTRPEEDNAPWLYCCSEDRPPTGLLKRDPPP